MFKFDIEQEVIDKKTNKKGEIVGCIGQLYCINAYLVRFDANKKIYYEEWRNEEQIELTEE